MIRQAVLKLWMMVNDLLSVGVGAMEFGKPCSGTRGKMSDDTYILYVPYSCPTQPDLSENTNHFLIIKIIYLKQGFEIYEMDQVGLLFINRELLLILYATERFQNNVINVH